MFLDYRADPIGVVGLVGEQNHARSKVVEQIVTERETNASTTQVAYLFPTVASLPVDHLSDAARAAYERVAPQYREITVATLKIFSVAATMADTPARAGDTPNNLAEMASLRCIEAAPGEVPRRVGQSCYFADCRFGT